MNISLANSDRIKYGIHSKHNSRQAIRRGSFIEADGLLRLMLT